MFKTRRVQVIKCKFCAEGSSSLIQLHYRVGKLEFLNSTYFHSLPDCEVTLSSLVCEEKRGSQFVI